MAPARITDHNSVSITDHNSVSIKSPFKSALLHGNLTDRRPFITRQDGNWEELSTGYHFYDAAGHAATACLGLSNHLTKEVEQAVANQQYKICNDRAFTSPVAETFAQTLVDTTDGRMARAYISGSGTAGVESAIKLAVQYQSLLGQKTRERGQGVFISRKQSYHGASNLCLSLGHHLQRRQHYESMLALKVSHLSPCNEYRDKGANETNEEYVQRLADELRAEIEREGEDKVMAFICEPVVGAALGCVPFVPGYLRAMMKVCQEYGVLFITDEVMCGFGRSGKLHAWQLEDDFCPDISVLGKGLGAGFPISAVLASHRVVKVIEKLGDGEFAHGHTHEATPNQSVGALKVIEIIKRDGLLANINTMGPLLEAGLKSRLAHHKYVGDIRGMGLFWGIEFVKDKVTKEPFDVYSKISHRIQQEAMKSPYHLRIYQGTGCGPDGLSGDHIMIMPAYIVDESEIDYIVDRLSTVIEDFFSVLDAETFVENP